LPIFNPPLLIDPQHDNGCASFRRESGEGRILIDAKVIRPLLAAWIEELCGISCFWIKCCYVRTFETITFEARKTQILNSIFAAML